MSSVLDCALFQRHAVLFQRFLGQQTQFSFHLPLLQGMYPGDDGHIAADGGKLSDAQHFRRCHEKFFVDFVVFLAHLFQQRNGFSGIVRLLCGNNDPGQIVFAAVIYDGSYLSVGNDDFLTFIIGQIGQTHGD